MSVTTWSLEMLRATDLRRAARNAALEVRECLQPQYEVNRFLYSFVGAGWGWTDKLAWSEEQWRNWAEDPHLRTWIGWCNGSPAGYFELHRQAGDNVEIAYFGLAPRFIGRGLGGDLLSRAIECAWAWGARRVWVHTCSLDHPSALSNYQARGLGICAMETR